MTLLSLLVRQCQCTPCIAIPNRTLLFHRTAAPRLLNIVKICVYKVQYCLISLWSVPSFSPSSYLNSKALLFEYAEHFYLTGICSLCLIRVWQDESSRGFSSVAAVNRICGGWGANNSYFYVWFLLFYFMDSFLVGRLWIDSNVDMFVFLNVAYFLDIFH